MASSNLRLTFGSLAILALLSFGNALFNCRCNYVLAAYADHDNMLSLSGREEHNYGKLEKTDCYTKLTVDCVKSALTWAADVNQTEWPTRHQRDMVCNQRGVAGVYDVLVQVTSGTDLFGDDMPTMFTVVDNTRNICCKQDGKLVVYDTNCKWH